MTLKEMVFGKSDDFDVNEVEQQNGKVEIHVESIQSGSRCPKCSHMSKHVHSYYNRRVMDLPVLGKETWIDLRCRKFFCNIESCSQKIFSERFAKHFGSRKKSTVRVSDKVFKIASLMGGNGGERICRLMHMPVSSSTLIGSVHQQVVGLVPSARVIGIDDWAFKKRRNYGTVVVDLEKRKIIDLLPDREVATVEQWMRQHPEVEIVSRDRYANYANAVSRSSSDIVQVAARWHLLKNLGDALQKVLDRNYLKLKSKREKEMREKQLDLAQENIVPDVIRTESPQRRKLEQKFVQVKELLASGYSISEVSRRTKVTRNTIKRWRHFDVLPLKNAARHTKMYLYEEKIKGLLLENPRIAIKEVLANIRKMGYKGAQSTAYEAINLLAGRGSFPKAPRLPVVNWMPGRTSILLYCKRDNLTEREKGMVDEWCRENEEINKSARLAQAFRKMVEIKDETLLDGWIEDVNATSISELKGFANGMLTDYAAVKNAIKYKWSNGQVEGQVNKLKTMKRQMYGRASFELLRKRLICLQ